MHSSQCPYLLIFHIHCCRWSMSSLLLALAASPDERHWKFICQLVLIQTNNTQRAQTSTKAAVTLADPSRNIAKIYSVLARHTPHPSKNFIKICQKLFWVIALTDRKAAGKTLLSSTAEVIIYKEFFSGGNITCPTHRSTSALLQPQHYNSINVLFTLTAT